MTLYLDTSSLVKLYVNEPGSEAVRKLVDKATVVATSLVAYPEACGALARRRRERVLPAGAFSLAKGRFEADWSTYLTVEVTSSVCHEAGEFAEKYRLRGYDAIHVASFAEVARRAGAGDTRFSSFDERLNQAARSLRRILARGR